MCLIQGALGSSGADEFNTQTAGAAPDLAPDEDFGRYRIIQPLGEGGMGSVYLAEQREPIRRRVALKVVKLGMDTAQVLSRFDNERQALAMMDHPNIAQIFDAGATPRGRPYFVMEYIEGAPITQYCDRRRLTTKERLALFLAVCRAVQHAHQKGVIHRDLKPSNVLVMEQDGVPVPKVIDFGIATATDKWAVEKTLLTQFGQIVGTPEYASPEQADTMTGEVDESSDVYSLGVILYELLIGAVPFDTATLRSAGLAEMLRIIREDEAPSLARKLTSLGAAATGIAERRQTDPLTLRRLVDGDLNSITMKALEKARERRYASVADLAADIQNHLEHRPVLASPRGRLYRSGKFLRRHRAAALGTAAGLVFLLLIGVTAWSLSRRDSPTRPRLTAKDTIVLADFDEQDRRSRLRRCAPSGAVVRARTIAVCRDFGQEGPADAGADGPVERRAGDAGHRAADLRANRKCDDAGGVDCQSWPPICAGLARQELHDRQHPRSTADPGGTARGRPRRAQPDRPSIQNPGRRIAGHG